MWNEPSEKPGTCTYSGKLFYFYHKPYLGYTLFAAEMIMDPDSEFFKQEGYFEAGYKVYIGPGKVLYIDWFMYIK